MVEQLENLNEEKLNHRTRVPRKVEGKYTIPDEYKRQLNIDEEIKTARQIFYKPKKHDSSNLDYLLNMDER